MNIDRRVGFFIILTIMSIFAGMLSGVEFEGFALGFLSCFFSLLFVFSIE